MGQMIAVFKLMPAGVETDLAAIEAELKGSVPDAVTVENVETKPVAFGLKALHVTLLMEDSEDVSVDDLEASFGKIDGVESVTVVDVGRL